MAKALERGSLAAIGLAGALIALAAQGAGESYVVPGSKAAALESCVEPTDFMRRNHMEVIKHQRDATVHQGIRSTKHSLAGCIECHVSPGSDERPVPVNAEGQFCNACHELAAVGLNCFDCHATIPVAAPAEAASEGEGSAFAWHPPVAPTVAGHPAMLPLAEQGAK